MKPQEKIDMTTASMPPDTISFFVQGIPAPGGSKKFVGVTKSGRPIVIDDCKRNKSWRELVAWRGKSIHRAALLTGPLSVTMDFVLPRPKSHFGVNCNLLVRCFSAMPTVRPDVLKLTRSTEDALTGVIWKDDAQIVREMISKRYAFSGCESGVQITITPT